MCNSHAARRASNAATAAQRGLSIIELMVSVVVALLVGLAATGSAISFTASQRVGVGSGGVAVNSATVLSSLKDDVAAAGLGFFGGSKFLCDRINLSMNSTMLMNGASFSPLQVTRTAAGDTVDVFYGDRVEAGASVGLAPGVTNSAAATQSFLPWATNDDAVVLAPVVPGPSATPCIVRTATNSVAASAGTPQQLAFAGAGKHNKLAFTNNPLASANYAATYLGDLVWSRYRVNAAGELIVERPMTGETAMIARNVISFRVEYGVAAAAAAGAPINTTLEQWVPPAGAFAALNANNLPRVRALRIGLVVRSPQRERPDPLLGCNSTDGAVGFHLRPAAGPSDRGRLALLPLPQHAGGGAAAQYRAWASLVTSNVSLFESRQRGVTMLVVMVLLSVMLLGALALGRITDVSGIASGNAVYREASLQASEIGINAAFAAVGAVANVDAPVGTWYSPQILAQDAATGLPSCELGRRAGTAAGGRRWCLQRAICRRAHVHRGRHHRPAAAMPGQAGQQRQQWPEYRQVARRKARGAQRHAIPRHRARDWPQGHHHVRAVPAHAGLTAKPCSVRKKASIR